MSVRRRYGAFIVCLFLAAALCRNAPVAQAASASSWPQFLGPNRNGVVEGTKLLSAWPTNGPTQVWTTNCGVGHAGPVVAHGILVLMERNWEQNKDKNQRKEFEQQETTRGLDAMSGRELWRTTNPCNWKAPGGWCWGPASTPAIGENKVVCLGVQGKLRCLELTTGKVVWEKDLVTDMPVKATDLHWGFVTSPLIVGDLVIVQVFPGSGRLVAWRLADGKEVWRSSDYGNYGVDSPAFMQSGDIPVVISSGLNRGKLFGLDARNGELVWCAKTGGGAPVAAEGTIYAGCEGNDGMGMCAVKPSATNTTTADVVWYQADKHGIGFSAPLCYKGVVFGHGCLSHQPNPHWFFCADAKDGVLLSEPRDDKARHWWFLGSDGKVLNLRDTGELILLDADARSGVHELARAKVTGGTWAYPALANGRLYVRNDVQLICLDLAGK